MTNPFEGLGHKWHEGSSAKKNWGYHNLPFAEYADAPTHRKGTIERIQHARGLLRPDGKRGLDIGCSVGGMTFGMQMLGAEMTGVDYDPNAIRVAKEVEEEQGTGAKFMEMSVPSDAFHTTLNEKWDFVIWLSNFMWVVKQQGYDNSFKLLKEVADNAPVLLFETAQHPKDGGAGKFCPFNGSEDVRAMLSKVYSNVADVGVPSRGWGNRTVFYCEV
jgi:SAM-dependent methyltransferase